MWSLERIREVWSEECLVGEKCEYYLFWVDFAGRRDMRWDL